MLKSFKFRIFPSHSQTTKLENTLELCRELYNAALSERREAWKLERKSISYLDQQNVLPEIKAIREDVAEIILKFCKMSCGVWIKVLKPFSAESKKAQKQVFQDSKAKIGMTVSRLPRADSL